MPSGFGGSHRPEVVASSLPEAILGKVGKGGKRRKRQKWHVVVICSGKIKLDTEGVEIGHDKVVF